MRIFLSLITVFFFALCAALYFFPSSFSNNLTTEQVVSFFEFASSVAGPITILWLIHGYFLQAKELKNQIAEMKNIAEANKTLSQSSKGNLAVAQNSLAFTLHSYEQQVQRELIASAAFYNVLDYKHHGSGKGQYDIILENRGEPAVYAEVEYQSENIHDAITIPDREENPADWNRIFLTIQYKEDSNQPSFSFILCSRTLKNIQCCQEFIFEGNKLSPGGHTASHAAPLSLSPAG